MTTISAEVVCDSVGRDAPRLATLQLKYPRCIHSEIMTHRVLSRNAGSSRAIPVERMIQSVMDDPFVPLHWGAAQAGMQAYAECDAGVTVYDAHGHPQVADRREAWLRARDAAVEHARAFAEAGYAKQLVNRLLEPFAHVSVVVTATEWENFFGLRDHPAAEPHFQLLARKIREAMAASTPKTLDHGEWHLPYVSGSLEHFPSLDVALKVSAARCARVSYKAYDGTHSPVEKDVELHDSLVKSGHWSPLEHQATPDWRSERGRHWLNPNCHGNLRGWVQYRKTFPGESGARDAA